MSYATLAELKAWVTIEDAADDLQLQAVLDSASSVIDQLCGRQFALETGATKLYWPRSTDTLDVVDLVSVTSLKTDSRGDRSFATTIGPTEYELLPHLDMSGQSAVRYQQIRIWPTSSRSFSPGRQVQIVGTFGFVEAGGAAPAAVKQACLILAARYWKRHETPMGTLDVVNIGRADFSEGDPDVTALLGRYLRSAHWVLV